MAKIPISVVIVTFCFVFPLCINASSCQDLGLAKRNWNKIKSPGFPFQFSAQTQCNWIIRAPSGYRLEVYFESFYLLGGVLEGCFSQLLKITDLYSKVTDGPYCGNTLPPSFVSTGQSVRITLESNAIGTTLYYKGFEAYYRQTRKPSSERLRDRNGEWRYYNVKGGELLEIPATTSLMISNRDPNEVDDNNNSEIDAKNNAINNKNRNNNEKVNLQNNVQNAPPTTEPPKPRPTRKRLLSVRTLATATRTPVRTKSQKIHAGRKINKKNEYKHRVVVVDDKIENASRGLSTNSVTAVVVAVVMTIIILILVFIYFYCKRKRQNRDQKMNERRKIAGKQNYVSSRNQYCLRIETQPTSSRYERRHATTNNKTYLPGIQSHPSDYHRKSHYTSRDNRPPSGEKRHKRRNLDENEIMNY